MDSDNQELQKKILFWKKFHTITNIILIIWVLVIAIYVAVKVGPELENFKTLNSNVCKLCQQKTGAVCVKSNTQSDFQIDTLDLNYSMGG